MTNIPTANILSKDPEGKPAGSTRKRFSFMVFGLGAAMMMADLWLNGGANLMALATFTASGPTLYTAARANHEIQVRKLG